MPSPPEFTAANSRPLLSGDAHLALLIREARAADPALRDVPKRALLRMAREFAAATEADRRDAMAMAAAHSDAIATGAFDDVHELVQAQFSAWCRRGDIVRQRRRSVAHDPRRHDWRCTS